MFTAPNKDSITADVKNSTSRIGNDVRNTAQNAYREKQSDFETAAHQIGQKTHDYLDKATHEITDMKDKVISRIHAKPLQSAAIGLGVGFLAGLAFRR